MVEKSSLGHANLNINDLKTESLLDFETANGTKYFWDNSIGIFFPAPPALMAIANLLSDKKVLPKDDAIEKLKREHDMEEVSFYYDWIGKYKKLRSNNYNMQVPSAKEITTVSIKHYILRNCLNQLTLNVTDNCNFRCKYCAYTSGNYSYGRVHSKMSMDFSTAKKAIDIFFSLVEDGKRYHPTREVSIGFFGGEPLLNFKLIKKAVKYITDNYLGLIPLEYNMTTNGSLLDREKADWLMENKFSIAISLDGPEEEHDRNRVYADGRSTFKDVIKNISYIMDKGYDRIFATAVWDWKSDFFKIEEFFKRRDIPPIGGSGSVSPNQGCKYFDQFSKEDYLAFREHYEQARKYYIKSIKSKKGLTDLNIRSFLFTLFNNYAQQLIIGPTSIAPPVPIMPHTSTCIPGWKLFVDIEGRFNVCEKIKNSRFTLGDVDSGLDFSKIGELLHTYYSVLDVCDDCRVNRACTNCFLNFEQKEGVSCASEVCKTIYSDIRKDFAEALEIAEANERFIEGL